MTNGTLLGQIVRKDDITVEKAILEAQLSANAKALSWFLGQIWWHRRMLLYLADIATPLHAAVHRTPFQWTEQKDKAYHIVKVML